MICINNDSRCLQYGYCSCHHDNAAEANSGCAELLIFLIFGVVVSFLYPSIKIARSNTSFDSKGLQKFAGSIWLFVSPLFAMLSTMLFQLVFAMGACAAGALHVKITNSIYICAIFLIYFAATGLATVTFLVKNREQIKLFFTDFNHRNINKLLIMFGTIIIAAIAVLALLGAVFTMAEGVYLHRGNAPASQKTIR